MRRITSFAIVAAAIAAGLGGCNGDENENRTTSGDSETEEPSQERRLVVYSGRGESLIAPALAAFEEGSEIDLEVKYADTAQLAAAILEEGERSPADVFLAQDASTLGFLDRQDTFAELEDELLDRVPAGFRSERGTWVGLSGRSRVLSYNVDAVPEDELPADVDELTEPRWKGRVGWAPENASFQSFVAAMIQLRGRDEARQWLEAMKANDPKAYPKNTPAVMAVSRGEVDVALVNHYYLHRLREEHGDDFPVANHYFRNGGAGALVNLSGGAVLASSERQEAAHELLAFLLSSEGQKHFVEGNHEFPAATGAASPIGLPDIDSLDAPSIDPAELRNLEETVGLLREVGVLR